MEFFKALYDSTTKLLNGIAMNFATIYEISFFASYILAWTISLYRYLGKMYKKATAMTHIHMVGFRNRKAFGSNFSKETSAMILCCVGYQFLRNKEIWIALHCITLHSFFC